jgi:hypothetical protein
MELVGVGEIDGVGVDVGVDVSSNSRAILPAYKTP